MTVSLEFQISKTNLVVYLHHSLWQMPKAVGGRLPAQLFIGRD